MKTLVVMTQLSGQTDILGGGKVVACISHTLSAATPYSTASTGRIDKLPLRSVSTRLHRHFADSSRARGTLQRFAAKKCEICRQAETNDKRTGESFDL